MSHEQRIAKMESGWNGATICFLARRIFAFCGQNAERGACEPNVGGFPFPLVLCVCSLKFINFRVG